MNGKAKTAYFFLLYLVLALGGGGLGIFIVTKYAPAAAPWFVYAGVYIACFVTVTGLAGCAGLLLRKLFGRRLAVWRSSGLIARQSALFGAVMTMALLFQAHRLLNLYTAGALVTTAALFELYVLTRLFVAGEGV